MSEAYDLMRYEANKKSMMVAYLLWMCRFPPPLPGPMEVVAAATHPMFRAWRRDLVRY